MIQHIPAIIFAGGKSSRMGRDKALLPFGGYQSLAQYQYNKLKTIFKDVYISTKNNKFDFEANLIYDTYQINSPLCAIISVLQYTKKPSFILSVDSPFLNESDICKIISSHDDSYIASIAQTKDGLQPLCGIYNPSFIPMASKEISLNNHKINYILKNHNTNKIYFEDTKAFLNLNYPTDYEKALKYDTI